MSVTAFAAAEKISHNTVALNVRTLDVRNRAMVMTCDCIMFLMPRGRLATHVSQRARHALVALGALTHNDDGQAFDRPRFS